MTPQRYQQIGDLYHRAHALPREERSAFLDETCRGDVDLRREVESLLAADDEAGSFMGMPPMAVAVSPAPDPVVRKHIGRYTVLGILGRGGMGQVHLAIDSALGRKVAIKLLSPGPADTQPLVRFEQEARAASSLNHPNIVTIHEIGEVEGGRFIAMEYVEGQPLSALTGAPVPLETLLPVGRQIAEALTVAHDAGIIHRDIKPENIMLRPDGYVKLLDFGVARLLSTDVERSNKLTQTGLLVGTPRYMAPEQVRGEPATTATDVFAFGTVLYELGTGLHPSAEPSAVDTAPGWDSPNTPVSIPGADSLPSGVRDLLRRMLDPDPGRRPTAPEVQQMLAAVDPSGADEVPKRLIGARTSPAPGTRWLPWLVVTTTMGAIVAAVIFAGLASGRRQATAAAGAAAAPIGARQITGNPSDLPIETAAISPEGRYVAYSDRRGIHVRLIDSGDSRLMPGTAGLHVQDWLDPGHVIGATEDGHPRPEQWSISLLGIRQRMPHGLPSPTRGYVVRATSGQLIVTEASGERRTVVDYAGEMQQLQKFVWSPDGQWIITCSTPLASGRPSRIERVDPTTAARVTLLESTDWMTDWITSLDITADGQVIFSRGQGDPAQFQENLWSFTFDQQSGTRTGEPQRLTSWTDSGVSNLQISASDDGKRVAVLRSRVEDDVYVASLQQTDKLQIEKPVRLTADDRSDYPTDWSLDSRWIYFHSNRSGSLDIYRQAPGEEAEVVVGGPGYQGGARIVPGGQAIIYDEIVGDVSIVKRMPIDGGNSSEVFRDKALFHKRCGARALCIVAIRERDGVVVYELDPEKGRGRQLARLPLTTGHPAVSPDGRLIAYAYGEVAQAIKVVDLTNHRERDIAMKNVGSLGSLSWASDGQGMWTTDAKTGEEKLWYVPLNGQPQPMVLPEGLAPRWAVPSPDGRRLAIAVVTFKSNVWLHEGASNSRR